MTNLNTVFTTDICQIDMVNKLCDDDLNHMLVPHIVYYNSTHDGVAKCTQSLAQVFKCTYSLPTTWRELSQDLETHGHHLAFHADMIEKGTYGSADEFVDAIRTMTRFIPGAENLRIAVVIKTTTPLNLIKQIQRSSVQGILLDIGHYSLDDVVKALNAFLNGIPYWPKEILQNLPGAAERKTGTTSSKLTPRQQQIFRLIRERGAINKTRARNLTIS